MSIKFLDQLLHRVRTVISGHRWGERNVLLVLDTFEELQAKQVDPDRAGSSGVDASNQIASWISQLAAKAGLQRLRVVVSGRAPLAAASVLFRHVAGNIERAT